MRKLLICLIVGANLSLSACSSPKSRDDKPSFLDRWSIVHRPEIQQGNIINQEMVDNLRPGMDKRQARFVMGTPLLVDVFHQDRWDYFYSLKEARKPLSEERMILRFDNNSLVGITGDLRPRDTSGEEKGEDLVVTVPDWEPEHKGFITRILEKLGYRRD